MFVNCKCIAIVLFVVTLYDCGAVSGAALLVSPLEQCLASNVAGATAAAAAESRRSVLSLSSLLIACNVLFV